MARKANLQPLGVHNEVGSIAWKASSTQPLMLNRENEVKLYKLMFQITHTNGATPALTLTDMFRLLTEVRIVAGGRNNIKMVDGIKAYINYCKNYGVLPSHSIDTTASTADLTSWVVIEVPMCMQDMKRPHDSIFPTYRFQNLDLKVQFGSATSVGTNVTVTAGSIIVTEDAIEDYQRGGDDYGFYKEIYQSKTITASNPKESFVMPVDMDYKQFTFVSTVDGVLSDAIINGVVIKSGSKVIRSYSLKVLKENMRKRMGGQITEANMTGILIVDFGERGHATEFLNTIQAYGGFKQLTIELDVTASGGVDIINQYSDYLELVSQGA